MDKRKMKTKKIFAILLVASLSFIMLSGCIGEKEETPTPTAQPTTAAPTAQPTTAAPTEKNLTVAQKDLDTLYIATIQEPTTLDPAAVYDGSDRATTQIYEGLTQFKGSTIEVIPCLATSWDISPDYKEYTFYLRKGVTFSDGTPFNADAVKFSYDRMMKLKKGLAWAFNLVLERVEVIDEYTVKFFLKDSYPAFLSMTASRYGAPILSPSVMKHEVNGDLAHGWLYDHAIGTGPYMLKEWKFGEEYVLVKNPNYWRGWEGKHVSKIVFKIVPEPSTQKLLLEKEEIDSATHITIDDLAELAKNPEFKLVSSKPGESMFNFFVLMNTRKGPLQNKKLREALSYAFPYEDCIKYSFKGFATQALGPLTPSTPCHKSDIFQYHRDIEKAKECLREAGVDQDGDGKVDGGMTLSIAYMSGQDWAMKILDVLTAACQELGISLQPKPLTWSAMMDNLVSQETAPDLNIADWWPDYPDPDSFLTGMCEYYFWGGREEKDYFYYNKDLVQILSKAAFLPDLDERCSLYKEAQEILVEDCPTIWVLDLKFTTPLRKEVHGFVFNPMKTMTYNCYDMWKEPEA